VFSFICLFYQGRRRYAVGIPGDHGTGPAIATAGQLVDAITLPVARGRAACGRVAVAGHGAGVGHSAVERGQDAAVGGRGGEPHVGRGPARVRPAAEGRRRGVRLCRRAVGPRPDHRVRRVRRQRGGQRRGGRGGQKRGPRHAGPESGVGRAQRQAGRERRASAAGHCGRDGRPGTRGRAGHVLSPRIALQ